MDDDDNGTARRFLELFRGNVAAHGTHGEPVEDGLKWAIKTTARTLREPVTVELWVAHLKGTRPLGIITIAEGDVCWHGSIDVDQYDIDEVALIAKVLKAKLPLLPARSKSGGLHLFIFFSAAQPARAVQNYLSQVAASLGLAGSEIFPKQTHLDPERGDVGNWMVMPYFGGDYDGKLRRQVGLKKNGFEMTPGEFLKEAERLRLEAIPEVRQATKEAAMFADGPPCLQNLARQGFPAGSRNNALFMIGIYAKRRWPDEWQEKLRELNRQLMDPPKDEGEVRLMIGSLAKKEYQYTCQTEPMKSFCLAGLCRSRKFGVGDDGGDYSRINIRMDQRDNKLAYIFDMGDGKVVTVEKRHLFNLRLFKEEAAEQAQMGLPGLKQADWDAIVTDKQAAVSGDGAARRRA